MHYCVTDQSFKDAVQWVSDLTIQSFWNAEYGGVSYKKKDVKAQLSREKQQEILNRRDKYTPTMFHSVEDWALQQLLKDPMLLNLLHHLECDDASSCFLQLYKYTVDSKLQGYQTFTDICDILANCIH